MHNTKCKAVPHTSLGNTGIKVSKLGLGTVKFGRNTKVKYPSTFSLPSDQQLVALLELAQAHNINLLDTAPAYGNSEARLGKLLTAQRHNWIIVTKVGEEFTNNVSSFDFSAKHTRDSIQRSLHRLQTDYLDIVLVHSDGNDLDIINNCETLETLATLKQQGIIRAYGMSTKTVHGGIKALELSDLAMVTYNPSYQAEAPVLDYALQHNKGIIIKKAFASGHLDKIVATGNPIATSLNFIFAHPAVNTAIIGTINSQHLLENLQYV